MQYFIHHNNEQTGPFTEAEVKAKLASGEISDSDHVWWEGQQGWVPLSQTPLAGAASAPTGPIIPDPVVTAANTFPSTTPATSKLAIASLACGVISLFCGFCLSFFGLFTSIPAIVLGHLALGKMKQVSGLQGRGMAIAGLILGYFSTVMIIILLILAFTLGDVMGKFKESLNNMRAQIQSAQAATNSSDQATPPASGTDQSTNNTPTATPTDNK